MSSALRPSLNRDNVPSMTTSQAREYVAAEVRAALARDGRSAAQLASDSGIPRSSLSKKLRAQVSLTVEELLAISTALSIDPGTLVPPAEAIAA